MTTTDDDLATFTQAVRNVGDLVKAVNTLALSVSDVPQFVELRVDDHAVRALQSIADSLATIARKA